MKQSELKAILKDHRLWIKSEGKQGKRANLEGANLQDANLRGANLVDANLEGAYLRGVNLYGADLRGAYLRGANLHGANLVGANLHSANLVGAYLQGANLYGAKFTTNFKKVGWFRGATFSEDQIPWVVLHPRYPEWAFTLTWVKVKADAA